MDPRTARRLRKPYRDHYRECQYSWALQQFGVMSVPWDWAHERSPLKHLPLAYELDHIYGKRGQACDFEVSINWMTSCHVAHMWKTNNTTLGRITAIWCKLRLRKIGLDSFSHFDRDGIRAIWGRDPIGMLQVWLETEELPEWARLMALDAIEMNDGES